MRQPLFSCVRGVLQCTEEEFTYEEESNNGYCDVLLFIFAGTQGDQNIGNGTDTDSVCDGIGEEDIGKAISRFLRNERETARNVFIRKYYFFDSVADIARYYGFTESKVKNMLFHTRSRLKEYLIKEGIEV